MHIVICNERLIPRYGVDRILLIIGLGLVRAGHHVTFVALRADVSAVDHASGDLHIVRLQPGLNMQQSESAAMEWLRVNWADMSAPCPPGFLLTGGWPFYGVADVARDHGIASAFIDAGAVPQDQMPTAALPTQRELRRIRFTALPSFTLVFPISQFICESQTLGERGSEQGVHTVLLGADHLQHPMFDALDPQEATADTLARCTRAVHEGHKLILALGRFEETGYKNSPAIFDVLSRVLSRVPTAQLLLLAHEADVNVPPDLRSAVIFLGYVSDKTLSAIIRSCALAVSTSLWEGFNLPIAEVQWYGIPALAFAIGAHPEVIADPWCLCAGVEEIAEKAVQVLARVAPVGTLTEA
jgi:glycosyltransferase involved in cell wall biosynthesis